MYQVIAGRLRQSFAAASGEAVGLGTIEVGSYFGCAHARSCVVGRAGSPRLSRARSLRADPAARLTVALAGPVLVMCAAQRVPCARARSYDSLLSGIHDTTVTAETEVRPATQLPTPRTPSRCAQRSPSASLPLASPPPDRPLLHRPYPPI